ncbi:hypothetical protein B0T22DRAFT_464536 [Podospora appendiculata]|uniref:Myb-like DNA-binding protein n=1 Tax=Podospora appendiculata TaxID=314037 RepID=A0AAE0X4E1_9PEZI|nr:hypothetical protein B0T22DRAFT_464536 [Podospora appendiculata]
MQGPGTMGQRRGPWSTSEDAYLIQLVETQGASNWVRISTLIGTRTPKQCRERYHQNLKKTLNHEPITEEEGIMIEQLVHTIGKRWAEIARRLQGRSDNAVKNWWNGSQNRRKRHDRRKANLHGDSYDEPAAMSPYSRAHLQGPLNTLPIQATRPPPSMQQQRPLPPPLLASSMHDSNRYYPYETPLSSPSLYSPDSELAPSLMSDTGSHYSTSPRTYDRRSPPDYDLPPIKIASDAGHGHCHGQARYSPRTSMSMSEKLPSLSAMVSIPPSGSPEYPRPPALTNRLPPMAPPPPPPPHHHHQRHYHHQAQAQGGDYFSHRESSYLPTAPSSPESPYGDAHLRPNQPQGPLPDRTRTRAHEYHQPYQRPESQRPESQWSPQARTTPEYGARRIDPQSPAASSAAAPPPLPPPADRKSEKRVMGVDSLLGP